MQNLRGVSQSFVGIGFVLGEDGVNTWRAPIDAAVSTVISSQPWQSFYLLLHDLHLAGSGEPLSKTPAVPSLHLLPTCSQYQITEGLD